MVHAVKMKLCSKIKVYCSMKYKGTFAHIDLAELCLLMGLCDIMLFAVLFAIIVTNMTENLSVLIITRHIESQMKKKSIVSPKCAW